MVEFLLKGFERTSMNDVVKRSGITKGGIYHYFSGKEELFRAIVSGLLEEMAHWIQATFTQPKPVKELFESFFDTVDKVEDIFFQMIGESGITQYHYFQLIFFSMREYPDLRENMNKLYESIRVNVASTIRKGQQDGHIRPDVDADSIAFSFNALYEGTIVLSQVDNTAFDSIRKYINNLWKLISIENRE